MGHHLVKNLPNLGGGGGGDFNDLHDNVVERKLLGLSLYCVVGWSVEFFFDRTE